MAEQITQFVMNNPVLATAWLAVACALAWTIKATAAGGARVTPAQATRLINSEDAVVLDVRPDSEFKDGHILNATNIALSDLSTQMGKLERYKGRPVITACRSGQQSHTAAGVLRKAGFEKVYNLAGGIVAWQDASLPLSKKK